MSLLTTIYKFIKPELTDSPPDFTATNPNWDKLETELKRQDDARKTHEADMASKLGRIGFNSTPEIGYKIQNEESFVINKTAYLSVGIQKTDETIFSVGTHNLLTVPHYPTSGLVALNAAGMSGGGTPKNISTIILQKWNKKVSAVVVEPDTKIVYITGTYLID